MFKFKKTLFQTRLAGACLLAVLAFSGVVSCSNDDDEDTPPTNPVSKPTVRLATDPVLGQILTDAKGKTLYVFAKDVSGSAFCKDGCLNSWPIFLDDTLRIDESAANGLKRTDFKVITRSDGARQTTYKGWPLYRYTGDTAPGETKGEGLQGQWFVAKPDYTLMIGLIGVQAYMVSPEGMTYYTFDKDTPNTSFCTGNCLLTWPAVSPAQPLVIPSILSRAKFQPLPVGNQLSYESKPLYKYSLDDARGTTKGTTVSNWSLARY
jgi:predicted lipoprotein with Yx(FWY)xxD motif